MNKAFLQAEWRKIIMANYAVDKKILDKYLPPKTEIDLWNNLCYVSLVGFVFKNAKIKGVAVPFHKNFEEVNLRFYVRHKDNGVWKRGVVFIKEIVPKYALSFVANTVYKEHYKTMPMAHSWSNSGNELTVEYKWRKNKWNLLRVVTCNKANLVQPGSEEEFITEHYWGYTKISQEKSSQYEVVHPKWAIYQTKSYFIDVDFKTVYGQDFHLLTTEKPTSVFLAEGSEIVVKTHRKIK